MVIICCDLGYSFYDMSLVNFDLALIYFLNAN